MSTAVTEMKVLLNQLPIDSDYEDIQYHLYVIEKINLSLARAEQEGTVSQAEVEKRFNQWRL